MATELTAPTAIQDMDGLQYSYPAVTTIITSTGMVTTATVTMAAAMDMPIIMGMEVDMKTATAAGMADRMAMEITDMVETDKTTTE